MKRTPWFERPFPPIADNGILPSILERLDGTVYRIRGLVKDVSPEQLIVKPAGKWSIQENVGHLSDLEPLWMERIDNFVNGVTELKPADLTNRKTFEADHNLRNLSELIARFEHQRRAFVQRIRKLNEQELEHIAMHPRLKSPMRIIDLAYFVAEHDDHHLADIREILSSIVVFK